MIEDPFTDEFLEQEIEFYQPQAYEHDGLKIYMKPITGFTRLDEYFNKNLRTEGPTIPMLTMDGEIWMSLTWLEVQSLWAPISRAWGRVGTAGLGMGYVALRMAAKDEVTEVVVYESDPRVIKMFMDTQGHRPEVEKMKIIEGDVYKLMVNQTFDFVLMDPYPTLLPDAVVEDIDFFLSQNDIREYRFWGQEKVLLAAINDGLEIALDGAEGKLIAFWMESGKSSLYEHVYDREFVTNVIDGLGRWRDQFEAEEEE